MRGRGVGYSMPVINITDDEKFKDEVRKQFEKIPQEQRLDAFEEEIGKLSGDKRAALQKRNYAEAAKKELSKSLTALKYDPPKTSRTSRTLRTGGKKTVI